MAAEKKVSTLILKVDLECCHCYKKIKRTLCKLQDRWNIKTIVYDEKNNTVTISGPFDPDKLSKKLCCKACKVIKDIQIKQDKPKPPPEPVPDPPPKAEADPPPPEPVVVVPEPVVVVPEPAPEPVVAVPEPVVVPEPVPEKVPEPVVKAPEPVAEAPGPEPEPACHPTGCGPPCCCWYHGMCRCCSCGRAGAYGGGWFPVPVAVAQQPVVIYGGPYYDGGYKGGPCYDGPSCNSCNTSCELICEEDRSCAIM